MRMEIAHTGRTGKETTITFDTDRKMFCHGREPHDVFIYAEQTRDVIGVIDGLKKIGYAEVTVEEFQKINKGFINERRLNHGNSNTKTYNERNKKTDGR